MEQQCKIGLRNRDAVKEDIISELPEALLLHILSSLQTETVIATSILSKRWRSLWKMVPNLKFNSEKFEKDEKEVAAYILKNARRLKKATISTEPIESKQLEKLEKRREMLNELASEVRDSNSCHLVFEADTYSDRMHRTYYRKKKSK